MANVKSGMIYFKNKLGENHGVDGNSYLPEQTGMKHERWAIHADYVEKNPEWFEEIKEDIVKEKPFVWTDELVAEYFKYTMAEYYKGETWTVDNQAELYHIKQFKASKQSREVLFTTEDGVDIYPKNRIWLVDKLNDLSASYAYPNEIISEDFKYFSTEQAAQQYIDAKKKEQELSNINDIHPQAKSSLPSNERVEVINIKWMRWDNDGNIKYRFKTNKAFDENLFPKIKAAIESVLNGWNLVAEKTIKN